MSLTKILQEKNKSNLLTDFEHFSHAHIFTKQSLNKSFILILYYCKEKHYVLFRLVKKVEFCI